MKKFFVLSFLCALTFTACSRSREAEEIIKVTQPAPEKGERAASWEIVHDSWASDADRDLVRDVRQALVQDPDVVPLSESVAIEASDGAIVLRGSGAYTLTMREWQAVGRRVKSVEGVRSVEIKSWVEPES
ncbi:MAG: hypothetical protein HYX74_04050 [Acidobacteria bacterium]|nr:hypothetical protein [Acidobacteriota bacterium]